MEGSGLLLRSRTARRLRNRSKAAIATAAAVAFPLAILTAGLSAGPLPGPGGSTPNAAFISIALFTMVFPLALITLSAIRKMEGMVGKLEDSIKFDSLTRVLSRSYFLDLMRSSRQNGYVLIVDADYFKQVNDTYGHGAGDAVLVELAQSIEWGAGRQGHVGRLGGEEFGVFLPGVSLERAESQAEGIRDRVAKKAIFVEGVEISVTVSIGAAFYERGGPLRSALTAADVNLFQAKRSGRNNVVFGDLQPNSCPNRESFRVVS